MRAYPTQHFTGHAKEKLLATFNVANDINNGKCRGRRRPCAPRSTDAAEPSGKWQVALAATTTTTSTRSLLIVLQTKRKRNKQPSNHPHTHPRTHTMLFACFFFAFPHEKESKKKRKNTWQLFLRVDFHFVCFMIWNFIRHSPQAGRAA